MSKILSIVTINRNNSAGLRETMESVLAQTFTDFEYIVVDGASTDDSVNVIRSFDDGNRIRWVSEPDKGIYNAMNKGIRMATGEYVQILNSGDRLASPTVVAQMAEALKVSGYPTIIYGNMIKVWPNGRRFRDVSYQGKPLTLHFFYKGTLNHNAAYIKRTLFEQYGCYDEEMRICSDWKWFFQAIILGTEKPVYHNIDMTFYDMTGLSEQGGESKVIIRKERRGFLESSVPPTILQDYDSYANDIELVRRLHRHRRLYRIVRMMERVAFKYEKLLNNK